MTDPSILTAPKPFVFVLMPLDPAFKDTYTFGIKGAAEDVGAYAERLDEQLFTEGMLDRIFNQISKSDVIVADMTNRNPNVFYEVGYAHALGKIVLLLTQNADDIPFDLKHRQHIVYGGKIEVLRTELRGRLQWAIGESRRRSGIARPERFSIRLGSGGGEIPVSTGRTTVDGPVIEGRVSDRVFVLPIQLRNDSFEGMLDITHVYLFTVDGPAAVPYKLVEQFNYSSPKSSKPHTGAFQVFSQDSWGLTSPILSQARSALESLAADPLDAADGLGNQFRLPISFRDVPPGAVEVQHIDLMLVNGKDEVDAAYRLRIHTASQYVDFGFRLKVRWEPQKDAQKKERVDASKEKKEGTDE
jgi:hypothetical protein